MTHPNPGKDTREQARALLDTALSCDCYFKDSPKPSVHEIACRSLFYQVGEYLIPAIVIALDRARREGMEEAAGIAWTNVTPTVPGWYLYRLPDQPLRLLDFTQRDIEKGFVPGGDYLWYGPIPDAGSLSRRAAKPDAVESIITKYYRVMDLLRKTKLPHGVCIPKKRRACTNCNAQEKLDKLIAEYRGVPVYAAALTGGEKGGG